MNKESLPDMPEVTPKDVDRFKEISNNYGELFTEVFAEQGLNYKQFEESVFENATKLQPNLQNTPVLDIGVGDGETSATFINAGCKKVVGIDLNPGMLKAAKEKLGDSIQLVQMDATKMGFNAGDFPIVVTGAAIHNIPKEARKLFWKELLRLSPDLFISAEKIADPDPEKHKQLYDSEVGAIKKVYGEKHGLHDAEKEWLEHYEYDERERLDMTEIFENIGAEYDIEIVKEIGMYKTVVAKKRNKK
jgi:SAM-dependent methyltransferase